MKLSTKLKFLLVALVLAILFPFLNDVVLQAQRAINALGKTTLPPNLCILGNPDTQYSSEISSSLNITWLDSNETLSINKISECCAIILKDDERGRYVGKAVREAVARQVSRGAGLIVVQSAALLVPGDPAVFGWNFGFGSIIPVKPSREVQEAYELDRALLASLNGVIFVEELDEAVKDVNFTRGLRSWNMFSVEATVDSDVIAVIKTTDSFAYPAIVGHKRLPVYYLAFVPTEIPGLLERVVSAASKNCAKRGPTATPNASATLPLVASPNISSTTPYPA